MAQNLINRCLQADGGSVEILADSETILAKLGEKRQTHGQWLNPGEVIKNYPGGMDGFFNPTRGGAGVEKPWASLTAMLSGLQKADLVLVAGRPSMGKSIVGMQISHCAARVGHGVAFVSLEMTRDSLVRRLVAAIGQVDASVCAPGR